ncbi:SMI1/KNR4 family protein [Metabacillus fastidiosus]|uniref:SMI1/KNR4 family protein n=1 Tax=Metabacillus fastidiosus TaxID=1458 RepID=A0ABU6NZM2_9BACI|nr:SMI1/KNR4 family protein [Metabacillus fastidiosus]MED4402569.1 SMI1/KNR4 family protein [Metabacillus fastidiosus]MED4461929.1 SMI1/KNR4 family protein [Metabacillus fastidiosus]
MNKKKRGNYSEELYSNKFENTKEILVDEDISDIEREYQFTFSQDIRDYYLTYNGGKPERYVLIDKDEDEYVVQRFIPIKHKNKIAEEI